MSRIFLIMRVISSISVGFSLLFLVYCIYEKFSGYFSSCKEIMTSLVGGLFKIATVILSIGLCCTIFLNASFQQKIGLYNYNLLKEGTYCFNIKVISSYDNEDLEGNIYPAQIHISHEDDEIEGDYFDKHRTKINIFLDAIYINDTILKFDNFEYDMPISVNKEFYAVDNEENEYDLKLLDKHAYSKHVKETNNCTKINILFLLIESFSIIFAIRALLLIKKEDL